MSEFEVTFVTLDCLCIVQDMNQRGGVSILPPRVLSVLQALESPSTLSTSLDPTTMSPMTREQFKNEILSPIVSDADRKEGLLSVFPPLVHVHCIGCYILSRKKQQHNIRLHTFFSARFVTNESRRVARNMVGTFRYLKEKKNH